MPRAYSKVKFLIEQTVASGLIYLNSHARDFANPEMRPYLDRYLRGSNGYKAEERVKLMKLFIGYDRRRPGDRRRGRGDRRGDRGAAQLGRPHHFIGHIVTVAAHDRPPLLNHGSRFAALVPLREEAPALPEFW